MKRHPHPPPPPVLNNRLKKLVNESIIIVRTKATVTAATMINIIIFLRFIFETH
ncbi:MAG: hypothetical protein P8Y97_13595 [Candidatus Lokiarchaeota archaeon]